MASVYFELTLSWGKEYRYKNNFVKLLSCFQFFPVLTDITFIFMYVDFSLGEFAQCGRGDVLFCGILIFITTFCLLNGCFLAAGNT